MAGKFSRKVVRPAVDTEAVRLLRDNPARYFEKERGRDRVPFGFAISEGARAKAESEAAEAGE